MRFSATVAVAVTVCCWSFLALPSQSQNCGQAPLIRFKPPAVLEGIRSYIYAENRDVAYTKDIALPPVVVQVTPDSGQGFDFSLDGLAVIVEAQPSLRLGGGSVQIVRGEATFDALTIQESLTKSHVLVFRVTLPDDTLLTLTTGAVVEVASSSYNLPVAVRFANDGFFTRSDVFKNVPVSPAAIPPFAVEVVNQIGYVLTVTNPILLITARDEFGATYTVTPPQYTNTLMLEGLKLTAPAGSSPAISIQYVGAGSFASTVSTGALAPVTQTQRNRFMLFDAARSFIKSENAGNTAVLGIPLPPIVINLYTSAMEADPSNTGLIITAATPQGTLSGAEALVVRGVATFSELMFVGSAPRSAVITFTAGTQGGLPVAGATLLSGALTVSVSAVKAKHMTFAANSQIGALTPVNVRRGASGRITLPEVLIEIQDSAYKFDPTANGFSVRLRIVPSSAVGGFTFADATVVNGVALFHNLTFPSASSPFQVQISDVPVEGVTAAIRASILSAVMTPMDDTLTSTAAVEAALRTCQFSTATSCPFTLRFASSFGSFSSSVYRAEQQIFTTAGAQIPLIVLELVGPFGVVVPPSTVDAGSWPSVVAFTGDEASAETLLVTAGSANRGQWANGRYYFSCLQFKPPAPTGLVRIQFMPSDRFSELRGISGTTPLRTGFITVTTSPVGNFGLRFVPEMSAIAYPGQQLNGIVNVALPPITLEIVDSLGRFDSSDSTSVVAATTSSGSLSALGATERVSRGRVTFSALLFTTGADNPVITFTVTSSASAVAGKSLSTGPILLTAVAVPEFRVQFLSRVTANNNVTSQFQSITVNNNSDPNIRASVVVVDSAGQPAQSLLGNVVIEVSSDEVDFIGTSQATVFAGSYCACANFSNIVTGYKPGMGVGQPAYLKYRVVNASNPTLMGRMAVAGPVSTPEMLSASGGACSSNLITPAVIGEFRLSLSQFNARDIKADLAFLLGIQTERITLDRSRTKSLKRIDHETLNEYDATKATFTFSDPIAGSTNRKSSADLASEFVGLRPGCDATSLGLTAAYYEQDDKSCDPVQFRQQQDASEACVRKGELTMCECYSQQVIATWGQVCNEEPSLKSDYETMCKSLSGCDDADIQNVCDTVLEQEGVNLIYLWGCLGILGAIAVGVAASKFQGRARRKQGTTLSKSYS